MKAGDRVRFPSRACGNLKWISGTIVDHEKNNDVRVGILPDRGQIDAGGSPISYKVPRFRYRSQVERLDGMPKWL